MPSDSALSLLVRMPNWLGDCVMALPALRHLARAVPEANIFLAGRGQFRRFFLDQPHVAGFVPAPAKGVGGFLRGMAGAKESVRAAGLAGVDLGLLFTYSFSTAAWMWRTGAGRRVGYDGDGRGFLLTHPISRRAVERSFHCVRVYLWHAICAEAVLRGGVSSLPMRPDADIPYQTPAARVGDDSRRAARAILAKEGVDGRYAVFAPASAYGAVKDWPPEHYRALAARLRDVLDLPVVVTGAAAQTGVCEAIARDQQATVNLAGKTGLDDFAGILAGASLFVGGDSGGAHLAGALGRPTVVVFGVTNPVRTRPGGLRVRCVGRGDERDVKLSTPAAREQAREALAAISPDMVMTAIREAMHDDA